LSVDEIDAEQWVYVVPTTAAENLISPTASAPGRDYGLNVQAPLQTAVTPFSAASLPAAVPETPLVLLLPLAVAAVALPLARRRPLRPAHDLAGARQLAGHRGTRAVRAAAGDAQHPRGHRGRGFGSGRGCARHGHERAADPHEGGAAARAAGDARGHQAGHGDG